MNSWIEKPPVFTHQKIRVKKWGVGKWFLIMPTGKPSVYRYVPFDTHEEAHNVAFELYEQMVLDNYVNYDFLQFPEPSNAIQHEEASKDWPD